MSKAIREAEKKAREREAAKIRPWYAVKPEEYPTQVDEIVDRIMDAISFEMLRLDKYSALTMLRKVKDECERLRERLVKT